MFFDQLRGGKYQLSGITQGFRKPSTAMSEPHAPKRFDPLLRMADNMLADAAGDVIKLLTTCMTLSEKVAKALCLT